MLLKRSQYSLTPCLTTLLTSLKKRPLHRQLTGKEWRVQKQSQRSNNETAEYLGRYFVNNLFSKQRLLQREREREQVETVLFDKYREYQLQECYLLVYFRTIYMYIIHKQLDKFIVSELTALCLNYGKIYCTPSRAQVTNVLPTNNLNFCFIKGWFYVVI